MNRRALNSDWILIVDDDPLVADTLESLLKLSGHKVRSAATGRMAMEALETTPPAAALLDIQLDDMSGLQLLSAIKELCPETECIMLTGHASQETAIEAVNLGAYAYVVKPYDGDALLLTLQRALEKRETLSALRRSEQRFRKLFENMHEAFISANNRGVIEEVNPAAARTLGFADADQMIGTNLCKLFTSSEDHRTLCARLREDGEVRHCETQLNRTDGTSIWVLGSANVTVDGSGRIVRREAIFTDITQRKRGEEALEFERSRLEMVTSSVGAGLAVISRSHKVLWTNDSVRRDFGNVEGLSCFSCLKALPSPCEGCTVQSLFDSGFERTVMFSTFITQDGQETEAQVVLTPLKDDEENVVAALELIIPITGTDEEAMASSGIQRGDLARRLSEVERVRGELVDMLELKDKREAVKEERWMSVDEVAVHMGVKRDTIYKWLKSKALPAHKVGKLWKFRKSELDHWLSTLKA